MIRLIRLRRIENVAIKLLNHVAEVKGVHGVGDFPCPLLNELADEVYNTRGEDVPDPLAKEDDNDSG